MVPSRESGVWAGRPVARGRGGVLAAVAVAAVAVVATAGASTASASQRATAGASSALPVGLRQAVSSTLGAGRSRYFIRGRPGRLVARSGGLEIAFGAAGPVVRARGGRLSRPVGGRRPRGHARRATGSRPSSAGNRVTYRRGGLTEWYRNGPLGLEQGFTLARRPAGVGRLTVAVDASGPLSGDGGTALVGAPNNAGDAGAVWIYRRQPPGHPPWALEAGPLTGADQSGKAQFSDLASSVAGPTAASRARRGCSRTCRRSPRSARPRARSAAGRR